MAWWTVTLSSPDAEPRSAWLDSLGIVAIQVVAADQVRCCFEAEKDTIAGWRTNFEALGFEVGEIVEQKESNWPQQCSELLRPIEFSALKIVPLVSQSDLPKERDPKAIYIIPGLGFGTGHHESTELALKLLERLHTDGMSCTSALDLGTGSGILALAAAKLFGCKVEACDIDPYALENASDNLSINSQSFEINLTKGSIGEFSGAAFDLVIANIYAEVLIDLEPQIQMAVKPGGVLLLSGIMSSLAQQVEERFKPPAWLPERLEKKSGWCAFLVRRSA
ncbi:MAG: 50S ribosomal protein L11 methyltransferase [Deltaproteobacteria bacterium]|nr:50S ribosomal protein L11 methyltransferase [Deltaproteobacteria bacterium]